MSVESGTRMIAASADVVRTVLLRPLDLPTWNPAFVEVTGPAEARVGQAYGLKAIRGLRGTFSYTGIGETRVDMAWDVPGMRERCSWTLRPTTGGGVEVTHELSRSGPLAIVLRSAFAGLAQLRLDRLEQLVSA
jgi:hypothetical protein